MDNCSVTYVPTRLAEALTDLPPYFADRALMLLKRTGNGHSGIFDERVLQNRSSARAICHPAAGLYKDRTANEYSFCVYLLSWCFAYTGSLFTYLL